MKLVVIPQSLQGERIATGIVDEVRLSLERGRKREGEEGRRSEVSRQFLPTKKVGDYTCLRSDIKRTPLGVMVVVYMYVSPHPRVDSIIPEKKCVATACCLRITNVYMYTVTLDTDQV